MAPALFPSLELHRLGSAERDQVQALLDVVAFAEATVEDVAFTAVVEGERHVKSNQNRGVSD